MNKKRIIKILLTIVFVLCLMPAMNSEAKSFTVKGSVYGASKKAVVKLNWKQKLSGTAVEVYRAKANAAGKRVGKYKKIKKISTKKRSFSQVVSSGKDYCYVVKAYQKKKGKKVYTYVSEETYVYTGYSVPKLEKENVVNCRNYNLVKFFYIANCGFNDGCEIYRKVDNGQYEKIAVLEEENDRLYGIGKYEYKDRNISFGHTYTYKVRAYGELNKKQKYSRFSAEVSVKTADIPGNYCMESLTKSTNPTSLEFKLESDKGNTDDIIINKDKPVEFITIDKKDTEVPNTAILQLAKYSMDGVNWTNVGSQALIVKPGETIYLSYSLKKEVSTNMNNIQFDLNNLLVARLNLPVSKNGKENVMEVNFILNKADLK